MYHEGFSVDDILPAYDPLRSVGKNSVLYLSLLTSVRQLGVLCPIVLNHEHRLIDGSYRVEAAKDARKQVVPAKIVEADREQCQRLQVILNEHRSTPDSKDLVRRLMKLGQGGQSVPQIARSLGRSSSWVRSILGLGRLCADVARLSDTGEISLQASYYLAKMPVEEQRSLCREDVETIQRAVVGRFKDNQEARRQRPHYRPMSSILRELERPTKAGLIICTETDGSPVQVWKAALRWAICQKFEKTS